MTTRQRAVPPMAGPDIQYARVVQRRSLKQPSRPYRINIVTT